MEGGPEKARFWDGQINMDGEEGLLLFFQGLQGGFHDLLRENLLSLFTLLGWISISIASLNS
jgi:hypothetical protein